VIRSSREPPQNVSYHEMKSLMARNNFTQIVSSPSYLAVYQTISEVNAHLSIPEKLWAAWYAWWRNDTLATGIYPNKISCRRWTDMLIGIMSFVMHELVYFGRSLPWIIIDAIPFFRKWKLQDVSSHSIFSGPLDLTFL